MEYGNIIQMQFARCGPTRQTISAASPTIITGLSILFTPKYANSLILLETVFLHSFTYVTAGTFYQDGATIISTSGYTNLCATNTHQTIYFNEPAQSDRLYTMHFMDAISAGSTATRMYDVRTRTGWNGGTTTAYVNNRSGNDMAGFGYFVVSEIYNGG